MHFKEQNKRLLIQYFIKKNSVSNSFKNYSKVENKTKINPFL